MASVMPQSQIHGSAAAFDDSMEISSDAGRQGDDDIDIDIEIPPDDVAQTKDDYMVDDDGTTAIDDDVMFDEDRMVGTAAEHMEEDLLDFEDEELEDVDATVEGEPDVLRDATVQFEDSVQHSLGDDPTVPLTTPGVTQTSHTDFEEINADASGPAGFPQDENDEEPQEPLQASEPAPQYDHDGNRSEHGFDEGAYEAGHNTAQDHSDLSANASAVPPELSIDEEDEGPESADSSTLQTAVKTVADDVPGKQVSQHENDLESSISTNDVTPVTEIDPDVQKTEFAEDIGTDETPESHDEVSVAEATVDISHLHPVMVFWEADVIPLFPPDDTSEYFLEDTSLATAPFSELFAAFRRVLGDAYSSQIAISVQFDDLGLIIDELESQAFPPTLADVIDVYQELHRNDGIDEPEPLRLQLKTREIAASRFSSLRQSCTEGKGISLIGISDEESTLNDTDSNTLEAPTRETGNAESVDAEHQAPISTAVVHAPSLEGHDLGDSNEGPPNDSHGALGDDVDNASILDNSNNAEDANVHANLHEEGFDNDESHLEEEYFEEDLVDDEHDPEIDQERLNESPHSSTLQGDNDETLNGESGGSASAQHSGGASQQVTENGSGTPVQTHAESWDSHQEIEEEYNVLPDPTEENPINEISADALETSENVDPDNEADYEDPTVDLRASEHASDQLTGGEIHTEFVDDAIAAKPNATESAADSLETGKTEVMASSQQASHAEDAVSDDPDDLDNALEDEYGHQPYEHLDEIVAGDVEVEPEESEYENFDEPSDAHGHTYESGDFGDISASDVATHADLNYTIQETTKKRSRGAHDDGDDHDGQHNESKKARAE